MELLVLLTNYMVLIKQIAMHLSVLLFYILMNVCQKQRCRMKFAKVMGAQQYHLSFFGN